MGKGASRAASVALCALAAWLLLPLTSCAPVCSAAGLCRNPEPAQILRLPVPGITDLKTLDPPDATDTPSAQVAEMVFPGLLALDAHLNVIPWAARALPAVSADGLTWTFTLRSGLKWSDGTPITATTYAYAIDRAENPCNAFGAAYYLYAVKDAAAFNAEPCDTATNKARGPVQSLIGDSLATSGPLTLQIQVARPAPYFLSAMTYPTSYAVPQQLIQRYGAKYAEHLEDGSGFGGDLFKVVKWDRAGHLVLQRNDTFWGQKPKLLEVDFTFYRSVTDAYTAFQTGAQAVGYAPVNQLAQARKARSFHQIATQTIDYFGLNWKMAPFDDIRMRQAFALALDKTALANTILHETVQPTNHIVPDGAPGYNPALLGPDGTDSLSGNIQLANTLATQYATERQCGVATDFSRCPPVTLTIFQYAGQTLQNEAESARQMWLKAMPKYPIGIYQCCDTLLTNANARTLQFWQIQWIEDYPDPQDWLSTNLLCSSPYNNGRACDPQADADMTQADASFDEPARLRLYQQAEQILVTEVAWIPLDQQTTWWETSPRLQGFTIAAIGLVTREVWQTTYLAG